MQNSRPLLSGHYMETLAPGAVNARDVAVKAHKKLALMLLRPNMECTAHAL